MEIAVTSGALVTLTQQSLSGDTVECCGLLLGRDGVIHSIAPCENVHPQPASHFEIDPAALIAAHRAAREGGPELLGYYHSHPTGRAEPSATDRASASGDGRIWAILAGMEIGWWRDGAEGFEALPLRVIAG